MLNQSLTPAEIERFAYIDGSHILAAYAADCEDQEEQINDFDDQLEQARLDGFDDGYKDGIGADTDTMLTALRNEVKDLKAAHQSLRTHLVDVEMLLIGTRGKTVAGRKDIATHISRKLLNTPRY